MHGNPALQIRQGERRLPVSAIRRAEQREQRGILCNRQKHPIAEGPASRREVEAERLDLSQIWLAHTAPEICLVRPLAPGKVRDTREVRNLPQRNICTLV